MEVDSVDTAVVLAGGSSTRIQVAKAFVELAGKPMIEWVLEAVDPVVDEIVIATREECRGAVRELARGRALVVADLPGSPRAPLVGALSGALNASGEYLLVLPCDQPLLSTETLEKILQLCRGHDALIPRWPNGYIEPLTAAYRREGFVEGATRSLEGSSLRVRDVLIHLGDVVYVDVRELSPEPEIEFLNVNTPEDLDRAREILEARRRS
mgnify:CR=1 FL=1